MLDISDTHKGTLLLVDDEANIVNSLKRIFIPLKYNVFTASNGCEGLEILKDNQVDVIISDMRMPEMDGAEFLKKVADEWPDVSRILLTGYADINSAISAINDGHIEYYLHKPWQPNEIEKTVQLTMEKRTLINKNKLLQSELLAKNKELHFLNRHLEEIVKEKTMKLEQASHDLKQGYFSVIQILASLCEQQVPIRGHLQSVANLSQLFAEKMGLSDEEVRRIYTAGLLHAIGKIGMPESITMKPYHKLSLAERKQFELYPVLGGTILMGFPALEDVAALICTHREAVNGRGYPLKLSESDLTIGSRILTIVIDYLELQQGLLLPEKLVANQALRIIQENVNKVYDSLLVDMFVDFIKTLPDVQEQLKECLLPPDALEPGMVLSRDLYTNDGLKLLTKGYRLTESTIATCKTIDKLYVHVIVDNP